MTRIKTSDVYPEIERNILAILRDGPMRQCEIADRLPLELYIQVGYVMRDMAARGVITREKAGPTYIVSLNTQKD